MGNFLPTQFSQYQHIAIAVISNKEGNILIAQRHTTAMQGGLWEFPGGKVDLDERVEDALKRELKEELGIRTYQMQPLIRIPHCYPEENLFLDVWRIDEYEGEVSGREGQPICWVAQNELSNYDFPDANSAIIRAISLTDYLLITPDPGDRDEWPQFLRHLKERLQISKNPLQVIFRAKSLNSEQYQQLASQVASICSACGAALQLTKVSKIPSVGLHLTSAQLREAASTPAHSSTPLSASCHDLAELKLAETLGVDFALLSPVQATQTHPDASPLGWPQFQEIVDQVSIPVYALGGMSPTDLGEAIVHGAQGIAAIRALWALNDV